MRFTVAERRARLAHRHRLATVGTDPVGVAEDLVALHATDPATVYLSVAARLAAPHADGVADALYERRTLIRMLGMRRTMFVVPVGTAPVVQAACTDTIAVTERRRLLQHLAKAGLGDEAWLADVERCTLDALEKRGSATAAQLSTDEPRLRLQLPANPEKSYETPQNITTRVLSVLAARGMIVRGRPRGTWISSQYEWSPAGNWLPAGREAVPPEEARVRLARLWLQAYGPASVADLKWWTGWTLTHTRAALAGADAVAVDLDGTAGVALADDLDPTPEPAPWVALLPALDPTVMGWVERDWYLGAHGPALFDRTGNAGPTVWAHGRVVGGWGQRADGTVAVRLLEDVGGEASAAIDAAANALGEWLGPIRITPRFRTPLERELAAG
ncbi:hypothetical protein Val02_37960 [Virgisporangium aliadipatigenens]|uniref:Winged helix DNA-binding domain-containing protein n=1 Tax=Virgisporangium aliadipatigenens TaxID=741659 RepID=A0A8J3YN31_9ACTN|nr:winged helix DNA-binding domain-containing protein [Virgisporangium aliadipatigenens]GIJ46910.1 hypothetical protein Val02_37960 [Virgisporangium aliadipatigenens]